jgi:tetratricopeptide (TPR) repeat protein
MWITVILMLLWQAVAAHAGPLEDCEQARDIDRRILGCTERVRQYPGDAKAFFNRGSAYLSKGDLDRAIGDNAQVIEIDPAYASAYYHRGIAYERREQYDQAIADFGKTVEINPRHGGAFDARARIYLKTSQHTLALRDAERAVSLDPFDEKFLDTRAHVYEALGRTQEAIADYRRVLSSNPSLKSAIDGLARLGASSPAVKAAPADAAGKAKRIAKSQDHAAQPRHSLEEIECERARYADSAGQYAGYPCWARAVLGPGNRGTGRR